MLVPNIERSSCCSLLHLAYFQTYEHVDETKVADSFCPAVMFSQKTAQFQVSKISDPTMWATQQRGNTICTNDNCSDTLLLACASIFTHIHVQPAILLLFDYRYNASTKPRASFAGLLDAASAARCNNPFPATHNLVLGSHFWWRKINGQSVPGEIIHSRKLVRNFGALPFNFDFK